MGKAFDVFVIVMSFVGLAVLGLILRELYQNDVLFYESKKEIHIKRPSDVERCREARELHRLNGQDLSKSEKWHYCIGVLSGDTNQ